MTNLVVLLDEMYGWIAPPCEGCMIKKGFAGFSLSMIMSLSSLVRVSDGRTWLSM
ncbi:hypothetical protein ACE6H2_016145 [Prunus campanulata]